MPLVDISSLSGETTADMNNMNILSVSIFAWSLLCMTASTDTRVTIVFDRFNRSLNNLNESFDEFTSILGLIPVEGLDHSVKTVEIIHQSAFQLVYEIYGTVRSIFEQGLEKLINNITEQEWYRKTMMETHKMESYSEGLLEDLKAVRKSILGMTEEVSACPEKSVLPIGPPRVYQLYRQRGAGTTLRDSNTTSFDSLIINLKFAVDAEVDALGAIGRILLELPTEYDNIWFKREGTVIELIYNLLGSMKTIILREIDKFADSEHDFEITNISIFSMKSITARIHAEALKECLLSLDYNVF